MGGREQQNTGPEARNSLTFQETIRGLVWWEHHVRERRDTHCLGVHVDG